MVFIFLITITSCWLVQYDWIMKRGDLVIFCSNKMKSQVKKKWYHTVATIPKSNRKMALEAKLKRIVNKYMTTQ